MRRKESTSSVARRVVEPFWPSAEPLPGHQAPLGGIFAPGLDPHVERHNKDVNERCYPRLEKNYGYGTRTLVPGTIVNRTGPDRRFDR
jgi:hypothetical protein